MIADWAYIVGGLTLLAVGAEGLVRGSSGLALRLGVSTLAIGLTVVAAGTGSPELAISVRAAAAGDSGIAIGNVVGSNIANIGLVLGVAALIRPLHVRPQVIRRELPLMIAVTLVLCAMLIDGSLSRFEGGLLLTGSLLYTLAAYVMAKREGAATLAPGHQEGLGSRARPVWIDAAMLVFGLVALLAGSDFLLKGAVPVARALGVSQVVIGLSVIAIGTSLPELATGIASARRDEADVAIGNALGSNVFNILAVLGATALVRPIAVEGLRLLDVGVMVGYALLLLPLMRRGADLNRWEGAALAAGYLVYVISMAV